METAPGPWIDALRRSHDNLTALVEPLDGDAVRRPSYDSEWTIAQVLSHLGSGAEIFDLFLTAGLTGEDPPGRDAFPPIWDTWNGRPPEAQATSALEADRRLLERFESLDPEQREGLHLDMFGMQLDTTGIARMRLGEHAIHTWDIAVALDPAATVAPDSVALLIGTLTQSAGRLAKTEGAEGRWLVTTTEPERHFTVEAGESVTVVESTDESGPDQDRPDQDPPELRLPAEALLRLVYGRLDPAHTPAVESIGGGADELDRLRRIFPGF